MPSLPLYIYKNFRKRKSPLYGLLRALPFPGGQNLMGRHALRHTRGCGVKSLRQLRLLHSTFPCLTS